ncbi:hypothetical protein O7627_11935 [Solwaraspora sp. WMMD1047]|uniref:DUF6884 domain-containing protein n=1 Tax=Solwaraspora sp. WMMD1047 TaxID=3016102 RepID=UPI00241698AF|nr:DUF6884 domain-containing protein [Solwaraspora sp. WMMD1047]MDG4830009.1 hypothetical protein [Solwaraspora sp. WMMD1047]
MKDTTPTQNPTVTAAPFGADPTRRLVIVGCSAEKRTTGQPQPALDLYDGGCVPPLRARLGDAPARRARIRILSAQHGLVTADTPLAWYDRPLDAPRAAELRSAVRHRLVAEFDVDGTPEEILIIAEPLYLVPLADLLALPARPPIHWIPDHADGWPHAATILDRWGW